MAELSEMTPAERDAYCPNKRESIVSGERYDHKPKMYLAQTRRCLIRTLGARSLPMFAPNRSSSRRLPDTPPPFVPAYTKGLLALTGAELLKREFLSREFLMSPWLPSKGLAMIFAERGMGKTWVGLNIGHATAGGGSFLRWRAPCPKRVVYIDGEMPAAMIKDRYAAIVAAADFDAPEDNFRLVAADLQPDGLPDLVNPSAQRFYDTEIADA